MGDEAQRLQELEWAFGDEEEGPRDHSVFEGDGRWQTRNGTVILIRDMSDEHLANAIEWATRKSNGKHPKVKELIREQRRRA